MTMGHLIGKSANSILRIVGVMLVKRDKAAAAGLAGQINDGAFWDKYVHE
jgi:hypothetical protein